MYHNHQNSHFNYSHREKSMLRDIIKHVISTFGYANQIFKPDIIKGLFKTTKA